MTRGPSPLLGYNTNVRHKGKLYHIQTEDSGVSHPHIITHLFADGGRIVASKKTGYAQHLGAENLQELVKKLMQEQHKAMFIALRDCVYDEPEESAGTPQAPEPRVAELDLDALERAAEARIAESAATKARKRQRQRGTGRYKSTVPAQPVTSRSSKRPTPASSIFSGQVLRSKSLDEVILNYLSDDAKDEK